MITLDRHPTADLGEVITIWQDGETLARLRQIGNNHPDVRLEWLTWENGQSTFHAIQFPCCSLNDITVPMVERLVDKYKLGR